MPKFSHIIFYFHLISNLSQPLTNMMIGFLFIFLASCNGEKSQEGGISKITL